ncbi:hypothetical protein WN943_023956 [Citrus x changshan-huyou]
MKSFDKTEETKVKKENPGCSPDVFDDGGHLEKHDVFENVSGACEEDAIFWENIIRLLCLSVAGKKPEPRRTTEDFIFLACALLAVAFARFDEACPVKQQQQQPIRLEGLKLVFRISSSDANSLLD